MATNINRVVLTGNLTRDPELRSTNSGMSVCSLRIAVNDRVKRDGEWTDQAGYYSVTVFGKQGENAAQYLAKGRGVAVDGKLRHREYTDKNDNKREAVEIIADNVQFLGGGDRDGDSGFSNRSDVPVAADTFDAPPAPPSGGPSDDDEIPFAWRPVEEKAGATRYNAFHGDLG